MKIDKQNFSSVYANLKVSPKGLTRYLIINPLIVRLLAQVGTFRLTGVAVASQVLCTSTTLNKRKRI